MKTASSPRARRRRIAFRCIGLGFGLGLASLAVEVAFRAVPRLVPSSFRQRFPPHGVEFFAPGVLDRTPIEGVPVPTGVQTFDGPPMHDIADTGVTRIGVAMDLEDVPRLVLPIDADGFPNQPGAWDDGAPDLALVGDSFAALASQTEPPGLVVALQRDLGVRVLNAAVPGIGPEQELYVLRQRVVPRRPRVVVWMVYGGNDFMNAYFLLMAKNERGRTLADLYRDQRRPTWILPALLEAWLSPAPESPFPEELPAVQLRGCATGSTWFHPDTLRLLAMPREAIQAMPAWSVFASSLTAGQQEVEAIGAKLLIVYVPGKEQVALPLLVDDGALLARYVQRSILQVIEVADDPAALLQQLRRNCGALEDLIEAHCAALGVPFWSATPVFREALAACQQVYYRADSHWRAEGQRLVSPILVEQLRELGLGR